MKERIIVPRLRLAIQREALIYIIYIYDLQFDGDNFSYILLPLLI